MLTHVRILVSSILLVLYCQQQVAVWCQSRAVTSKTFQFAHLNLNTARQVAFILSVQPQINTSWSTHKIGSNIEQGKTMSQLSATNSNRMMPQHLLRKKLWTNRASLIRSFQLLLREGLAKGSQSESNSIHHRLIRKSSCNKSLVKSIITQTRKSSKR